MLGKLLKYEFKSTARIFLPLYALVIIFSVICRVFNMLSEKLEVLMIPGTILYVLYSLLIIAVIIITFIAVLSQFYKNLIGDEGYLMFTIPVEPYNHILTKMIVSVTWIISSVIIGILSLFILIINKGLWEVLAAALKNPMVLSVITHILIIMAAAVICNILMIYTSISLGQLVTGHKIIGSVAAYLGLYMAEQIVGVILLLVLSGTGLNIFSFGEINNSSFADVINGNFLTVFTLLLCGEYTCFSVAYFCITNHIFNKKLNLE